MWRRVCVRDVNLAVTVLRQYRKFTQYRELHRHGGYCEWYIRWFSPTFLTRNQAKILILKGLNRRRSTPWDWGIILILFWFGVWFCWLDGIIILPRVVFWRCSIAECQHWYNGTIHDVLHAYVSWLWRGSSLVKMHWRWNLAHSGHSVTFLRGCIQWYDYNHPFISVVLWPFDGAYHQIQGQDQGREN